jgi:hypothetical protein
MPRKLPLVISNQFHPSGDKGERANEANQYEKRNQPISTPGSALLDDAILINPSNLAESNAY